MGISLTRSSGTDGSDFVVSMVTSANADRSLRQLYAGDSWRI